MKNGSGQIRILDVCETPVTANGEIAAILSVGRDITEEALLEDKLWETQETRDSAVEYAVRASLDLIKGYIYSMRKGDTLSESQRAKFGGVVMDEIEALSRTVENLLSARGLHDDSMSVSELCEMKTLISAAVASVEAEAQRREIRVCRDEPVEAVEVHVPETAMIRLLQNLLEHCVLRITHDGQIHVKMQDSGEYVDIQISDNGSNVSEDQLRSLFVLRPQSARGEEAVSGSRTALYVARLFAEAMGGAVSARTSAEGGLEFHLMLPRQTAGFTSAHVDHEQARAQTTATTRQ
jgi:K+-sensing histidine kinase KdpD